ncbi:MAG: exo-beta-N-acetylmuramidase NamZ domain-containing protein [Bacteroidota bacterium]
MRNLGLFLTFAFSIASCNAQFDKVIVPGAERIDLYNELLEGKTTGVVANHTSLIRDIHLVDLLISRGVKIEKIYSPEHGFRGTEDAGAKIEGGIDVKTGIQIISLYGKRRKPSPEDLVGIDIMVFDLQDVGARFYTYISSLHYVMEACAENNIPVIVFDRPNPNGNYIDGPILDPEYKSFVGMHPVPVVYGMTIGEYAGMINGEKWLNKGLQCDLKVIECENYCHSSIYNPPVKPSPNLPNYLSVKLYPSLCFFEGTAISVGRGTEFPFQVFGHPDLETGEFYFTPESKPGAAVNPKLKGEKCRGVDLRDFEKPESISKINLEYLLLAYQNYPEKEEFFNSYFNLLSGNEELKNQIVEGKTANEIRISWKKDIEKFMKIREKYLLYEE